MAALTDAEAEDMEFVRLPEAQMYANFDEDLAKEAKEIMEALGELQEAWRSFSRCTFSPPRIRWH